MSLRIVPLSIESARSVRQAAIAIRYHGARYLPVVDDGRLVGIVAFRVQRPRTGGDSDPGLDLPARDGAARCFPGMAVPSSSVENR